MHQRLVSSEERLRQLLKLQEKSLSKENVDELKKILREIEEADELHYSDIKKTKITEPIQNLKIYGIDVSTKLQETRIR